MNIEENNVRSGVETWPRLFLDDVLLLVLAAGLVCLQGSRHRTASGMGNGWRRRETRRPNHYRSLAADIRALYVAILHRHKAGELHRLHSSWLTTEMYRNPPTKQHIFKHRFGHDKIKPYVLSLPQARSGQPVQHVKTKTPVSRTFGARVLREALSHC